MCKSVPFTVLDHAENALTYCEQSLALMEACRDVACHSGDKEEENRVGGVISILRKATEELILVQEVFKAGKEGIAND
ncbi:hypothetical protein ACR9GP_25575 [Enterobacter ludwigii]